MSGKIMIAGVDTSVSHKMQLMIQNHTFSTLVCFIFSSLAFTYGMSTMRFNYVRIFASCAFCELFDRCLIQLTVIAITRIRKRRYARRSFYSSGLSSLHLPLMPRRYNAIFRIRISASPKNLLVSVSLSLQQRVNQLGQQVHLGSSSNCINFSSSSC